MSRNVLRLALRNLLGSLAPEVPMERAIAKHVTNDTRDVVGKGYNYTSPYVRLNVYEPPAPHSIWEPSNINWNLSGIRESFADAGKPAWRIKRGRQAMRDIEHALENHVKNHNPGGVAWHATSLSRSHLYDQMMRRLADKYGYSPTLKTRLNRVLRGAVRHHMQRDPKRRAPAWAQGMVLSRDHYRRRSAVLEALRDLGLTAGPAALGFAAAESLDD